MNKGSLNIKKKDIMQVRDTLDFKLADLSFYIDNLLKYFDIFAEYY